MQKKLRSTKNGRNNTPPKKVGIIYSDVKQACFATEAQYITEKDAVENATVIGQYLTTMGIAVSLYAGNESLPYRLNQDRPEVVINLVDSVQGDESLASSIPGVLGFLNIPFSGADTLGLSLDTNKFFVKKLLRRNGVPVPNFQLLHSPDGYIDPTLRFPVISKLNAIHGAVEITRDAISENVRHLRDRLRFLIQTYHQPVLVEEFIAGREITAILLEEMDPTIYMAEKVFFEGKGRYVFSTFEDEWLSRGDAVYRYEKFDDQVLKKLIHRAFAITRMFDYGKFDVRLDPSGHFYFIDTNCNPAFGPKELDVALSNILDLYGIPFHELQKTCYCMLFEMHLV